MDEKKIDIEKLEYDQEKLSQVIEQVLAKRLFKQNANGVVSINVPEIKLTEADRLKTGNNSNLVYTKDILTREESERLGCGIMEMDHTTFDWTLNYDEIDYVIEGKLSIIKEGKITSAHAGQILFIPKGSKIQFAVADHARFLYVTYPADWEHVE